MFKRLLIVAEPRDPPGPLRGGKGPEAAAAFEQDSLSPLRAGPLAVCAPKVLENSYSSLNPVSPCVCVCVFDSSPLESPRVK